MTKETKVGLVISGSFLLLLGAVIGHRLLRGRHESPARTTPEQAATIDPVIDVAGQGGQIAEPPKQDDQIVPAAFSENKATQAGQRPGSVPQHLPKQAAPLKNSGEFAPAIPLPPDPDRAESGGEDRIAEMLKEQKKRLESKAEQDKSVPPAAPPSAPVSVAQGEKPSLPMPRGGTEPSLPTPPVPAVKADEKGNGPPPPPPVSPVPPPPAPTTKKNKGGPKVPTPVPPPPPTAVPPAAAPTQPDKTAGVPPLPGEKSKTETPMPPPPKVTQPAKKSHTQPAPSKTKKDPGLPPAPGGMNVPSLPPSGSSKKSGNVQPVPPAPPVKPVPPPPESQPTPVPPAPTKTDTKPTGDSRNSVPPPPKVGENGKAQTPAISVPMPPREITRIDPKSGVKVTEFVAQQFRVTDEVRTIEDISRRFYYSGKYATALLKFNREKNYLLKGIHENPPRLSPGDIVLVPPTSVLEAMFPSDIPGVSPLPVTPPIKIGATRPASPRTQPPAVTPSPPRVPPTRPPIASGSTTPPLTPPIRKPRLKQPRPLPPASTPGVYIVQREGEMLFQIARDTLGDGRRWPEIWRLNRQLRPELPVPVGTRLRLPVTARR